MILNKNHFMKDCSKRTLFGKAVFDEKAACEWAWHIRDNYSVLFTPNDEISIDKDGNIFDTKMLISANKFDSSDTHLDGFVKYAIELSRSVSDEYMCADKDIKNIGDAFGGFDDIQEVRHAYTIDGIGYFIVINKNGQIRSVPSEYKLEVVGGIWSLRCCKRLYFAQAGLIWYLQTLKRNLHARNSRIIMEIKPLYISYIYRWKETLLSEYEDTPFMKQELVGMADKILLDLKNDYPDECTELEVFNKRKIYGKFGPDWYCGYAKNTFNDVCVTINDAISILYSKKGLFEKNGVWDKVKKEVLNLHEVAVCVEVAKN